MNAATPLGTRGRSVICLLPNTAAEASGTTEHRIIEAMKLAYAQRALLGDPCCAETKAGVCTNQTQCSMITPAFAKTLDEAFAEMQSERIQDNATHYDPAWYSEPHMIYIYI